jgi:predicted glycogen debranching enzyme
MGTDDEPAYNSVDAPLWFFWTLQEYAKAIGSTTTVWKTYGKAMKEILVNYRKGTHFNIKMHENGLIYAGEPGKALTWMDAVVNGIPVTPRMGYPVEINALWYNAIAFTLELAKKAKDQRFVSDWKDLPELIRNSFLQNFWDPQKGYLADFVDNDKKDWSVRPNQVIAVSLDYSPLSEDIKKHVLEVVKRDLLTSRGLRTLSPNNENYEGIYEGNQEKRDKAYHQGTVWPWLLEHFCRGYLKIYNKSGLPLLKKIIADFEPVMSEHGIGTISEIYDGNPPHYPKGAISQAWSVAALLSVLKMIEDFPQED